MVRTLFELALCFAAGFSVTFFCIYAVRAWRELLRPIDRIVDRRPNPVPPFQSTKESQVPTTAIPLHCRWCGQTTFHLRRRHLLACEFQASHHATDNYQLLAASMPESDQYPGCICFPGERTIFNGKPDPFCFATEHRP